MSSGWACQSSRPTRSKLTENAVQSLTNSNFSVIDIVICPRINITHDMIMMANVYEVMGTGV